jgi:peptidoglycan/LPS O-acetylase OafA/YrhL
MSASLDTPKSGSKARQSDSKARKSGSKARADIQALRALAIVSVLLFHLWPDHFKGGFIGVDIFFVISGFLISGQLWREIEATGTVQFSKFWARRARRLLPASLLVISSTVLVMVLLVPAVWFKSFIDEALGSIGYVQNWVLAAKATDYLAANTDLSPFMHFWSLLKSSTTFFGP